MFCKNCGAEMADTDKVCASCGTPVGETPAPAQPTPVEQSAPVQTAVKGQIDPLRLSALICQSVGALFMLVFCFQLMNAFSMMSSLFDLVGAGFVSPLISLLLICAAAAAIFVPVCLWLVFAGKLTGNGKLGEQGQKLLPVSILVQLIVEAVIYGLLILLLLFALMTSEAQSVLKMTGMGGNAAMAVLGVIVMAAAVIFLHAMALKLTKGAAPDMVSAVACFVAGGVHALTLLFMLDGGAVTFLLLVGYAAADIIYGLITMQKVQK